MKFIKKGLVIISILFLMTTCTKSTGGSDTTPADCSGIAKTFSTDVNPIIESFCATNSGCHGTGSNNGPGAMTTYSQIFNARTSIRSAVISGAMPKNASLTSSQKNSIICWIDNGALDN